MRAWMLEHVVGGRNECEADSSVHGLFVSADRALAYAQSQSDKPALLWERVDGNANLLRAVVTPFVESTDADKPCGGEWWALSAWEVVE